MNNTMYLLILLLFSAFISSQGHHFEVSRAECKSLDLSFSSFKHCDMKTVGKKTIINIHVAMRFKKPIDDVTLGLTLFKITKSYRIPILNETLDFCAYMREPKLSKMYDYISGLIRETSNINHTCPYQHDIIVVGNYSKPILPEIPAPSGNYIVQLHFAAFKKWKAVVKIYTNKS